MLDTLLTSIERPFLAAASKTFQFAYDMTGMAPARLQHLAIASVSIVKLVIVCVVVSFSLRHGEFVLLIGCLFVFVDIVSDGTKAFDGLGRASNIYDRKAYETALAEIKSNRWRYRFMRSVTLVSVLVFTIIGLGFVTDPLGWISLGGAAFMLVYGARFFFRGCQPPVPRGMGKAKPRRN